MFRVMSGTQMVLREGQFEQKELMCFTKAWVLYMLVHWRVLNLWMHSARVKASLELSDDIVTV